MRTTTTILHGTLIRSAGMFALTIALTALTSAQQQTPPPPPPDEELAQQTPPPPPPGEEEFPFSTNTPPPMAPDSVEFEPPPVPATVTVAWDPSPDAATPGRIAGYKVYYGTTNFSEVLPSLSTQIIDGDGTNAVIADLMAGETYYFGVTAFDSNQVESALSSTISHTITLESDPDGGSTGGGLTSGGTGGSTGTTQPPPNEELLVGQVNIAALLPRMAIGFTNQQMHLTIMGAYGADFLVQASTNLLNPEAWTTVGTIRLTNGVPIENPEDALDHAFVAASATWTEPPSEDKLLKTYRIIMPHNFTIVAADVLAEKGYVARLVAVRLPGVEEHTACYVMQDSAYIDYDTQSHIASLRTSGSTIRQIATRVADSLSQNWTTASEFVITNGLKMLLATVVKTDSPDLDQVAGNQTPQIVIDF